MYTEHQFEVMNALANHMVIDNVTGFRGIAAGFCVYPEYEGKHVNVLVTCCANNGDLIEKWIWDTRLGIID